MDRWILQKLNGVIERANEAFDDYEFHVPTFAIHQFCVNELSSFYARALQPPGLYRHHLRSMRTHYVRKQ